MAIQRVNAVSFQNTTITEWSAVAAIYIFFIDLLGLAARGWITTYTYRHTYNKKL